MRKNSKRTFRKHHGCPRVRYAQNTHITELATGTVALNFPLKMATNPSQTRGFRSKLAESHIALVAVTLLVMWSLDSCFRLTWTSLSAALWLIAKAADFLN